MLCLKLKEVYGLREMERFELRAGGLGMGEGPDEEEGGLEFFELGNKWAEWIKDSGGVKGLSKVWVTVATGEPFNAGSFRKGVTGIALLSFNAGERGSGK